MPLRACLVLLAFCTLRADGVILSVSGDSRDPSIGVTADQQWDGVGCFLIRNADDGYDFGWTGVLISDRHVLTCAHALEELSPDAEGIDYESPSNLLFLVGGGLYPVEAFAVSPRFSPWTTHGDIAVVRLRGAVTSVNNYPFNRGQIDELATGEMTIVGCGRGGDAVGGLADWPSGVKRVGTNRFDLLSDGLVSYRMADGEEIFPAAQTLVYDFDDHRTPSANASVLPGGGAVGPTEATTAPGDSGGPMFQADPQSGQMTIVGIASGGFSPSGVRCRIGNVLWSTRVAEFARFVDDALANRAAYFDGRGDYPSRVTAESLAEEAGLLREQQNDFNAALDRARRSLALDPGSRSAHTQMAYTLHSMKRHREALKHYKIALTIAPNYWYLWQACGNCFDAAGDPGRAAKANQRAKTTLQAHAQDLAEDARRHPDAHEAQLRLGVLLRDELGDFKQARAAFDAALKLAPDDPWSWFERGICRERQGDHRGAVADATKAIGLSQYPEFHRLRANNYDVLGQQSKADFDRRQADWLESAQ